ncbi:MAG: metal-dependent hydrolase [Elainellaceae cyanobacterium]
MPSPIAHSITGYVILKSFSARDRSLSKEIPRKILFAGAIIAANVADLDFIPQVMFGADFHRGFTHSLAVSVCFSLLAAAIFALRHPWKKLFLLTELIYLSHLLLDLVTAGGSGMQLFWPFSSEFIKTSISLFPSVHHSEGLFYSGHIVFIVYELIYAVLLVVAANFLNAKVRWNKSNYQNNDI